MTPPLVSCVIPAYNYGRYLDAAIDSVLAQDWPADRLDIVVVDDGSTDQTPAVLGARGSEVRVIRQDNAGVNTATTTGMLAARGELITFLDADDTWPRGRLRRLAGALANHPEAGLVWGDMEVVDGDGVVLAASFNTMAGLARPEPGRALESLVIANSVSAGAMMIRANLRDAIAPIPPFACYQDWWIAVEVARRADVIGIDAVVNRYRRHGDNANLDSSPADQVRLLASEIPYRRWLLRELSPAELPAEHLVRALARLDSIAALVARARETGVAAVYEVAGRDRDAALAALHDASAALDAGEPQLALALLVRSVAHDPIGAEARELLRLLAQTLAVAA